MRRILGIDPGSRITGIGVIEHRGEKQTPICLFGGCIRLNAKEMPLRLGELFHEIQDLVKVYRPTELAIEQVFVHKSVSSALKLGQARGVAIAAAMSESLPVFEYAPRQIKQAIVGKGSAEKAQIQHMIQILLNLNAKPQADAADALAVAMCHLHMASNIMAGLPSSVRRKRNYRRRMPLI